MSTLDQVQRDPAAAGRHNRSQWSGMGRLILLCLISITALGLFVAGVTTEGRPSVWDGLFASGGNKDMGLRFGGVFLGMPLSVVERARPDIVLAGDRKGETTGSFQEGDTAYTVWFLNDDPDSKAYRVRYDRTDHVLGEEEILGRFGRKHGRPMISDCGQSVFAEGVRCHFRWLTGGGVPLDVYTRVFKDTDGGSWTALTVIAEDIQPAGPRSRARPHARIARRIEAR